MSATASGAISVIILDTFIAILLSDFELDLHTMT